MPRVGFEPAIPATKRPQTYALDRAATGFGNIDISSNNFVRGPRKWAREVAITWHPSSPVSGDIAGQPCLLGINAEAYFSILGVGLEADNLIL
jgi:hypothetical protein